ncbi:glycoside hydrolase family 97 protein [Reichenbachiella sp. 5M10]|uniref:glycoside hydrolase family 97 protein n=1 Tax=Reichenbachiella sp. 5M10 TaxID=1889772 RepID=UPI001C86DED1|nr:glycoside hydrolase family 97 protein [Reichenbachiella sp. 5M10]
MAVFLYSCNDPYKISSPNGRLTVSVKLENGEAYYSVSKDNQTLIADSRLGFVLKDQQDLKGDFEVTDIQIDEYRNTWQQPWGEVKNIVENYNRIVVSLEEKRADARQINVVFKVFDDGVGFRYEFPEQDHLKEFVIMEELTEFNLVEDMDAWWIPAYGEAQDSEYLFAQNKVSELDQPVHTPLTMEQGDSLFVSIHEAALVDYSAMTLTPSEQGLKSALVPLSTGELVVTKAPTQTPWRSIQITESAGELMTSYLILNLNEPNKIENLSWLSTGKYLGIWWAMHVKTQTWVQGEQHGATTENVKEMIDFAARHAISGVLVEGWNVGWGGNWAEGSFRFAEPYDDFDIDALSAYAAKNRVELIGHNETGANVINYEAQLEDALAFCQHYGISALKTGYVGDKLNGKEYHQSQYGVDHFNRVTELAAKYQVMLDIHEPVKATGLRRTYPHLMTREGARGTEYEAWSEGNPPEHTVILPFTRGLGGPLDYTPGIFDLNIKTRPDNRVHTTLAKQLALYVTIYSPWQMAADLIDHYEGHPAFQFIQDVPTDWEDTKVLNAKIGDYLTVVRKDRASDDWYLGSITDENKRTFKVDLDFLIPGKKYKAEVYADGLSADVETNPTEIRIEENIVSSDDTLVLALAPGGGQAIRFELMD